MIKFNLGGGGNLCVSKSMEIAPIRNENFNFFFLKVQGQVKRPCLNNRWFVPRSSMCSDPCRRHQPLLEKLQRIDANSAIRGPGRGRHKLCFMVGNVNKKKTERQKALYLNPTQETAWKDIRHKL